MWKKTLAFFLAAAVLAGLPPLLRSDDGCGCGPLETKQWTFDSKEALAGWTVTGDVGFDNTQEPRGPARGAADRPRRKGPHQTPRQGRIGQARALGLRRRRHARKGQGRPRRPPLGPDRKRRQGVGGRHPLQQLSRRRRRLHRHPLRRQDLVQRVVLAGRESQAAGWHKWTFDFDPEAGLQVFHNGKELGAVDPAKVDLEGFHLDRRLGRPERRPRADHLGLQRQRDAWAGRSRS